MVKAIAGLSPIGQTGIQGSAGVAGITGSVGYPGVKGVTRVRGWTGMGATFSDFDKKAESLFGLTSIDEVEFSYEVHQLSFFPMGAEGVEIIGCLKGKKKGCSETTLLKAYYGALERMKDLGTINTEFHQIEADENGLWLDYRLKAKSPIGGEE